MEKTALKVGGAIFLLIAAAHFIRVVLGWAVTVNGQIVPLWVSVAGAVATFSLAIWMFSAVKNK